MGAKTRKLSNNEGKDIQWQTPLNADGSTLFDLEAGKGYFLNTSGGEIEVRLPSSPSTGDSIAIVDYTGNFSTNQCIINTQGNKLGGLNQDIALTTANTRLTLVYADSTNGWMSIENEAKSDPSGDPYSPIYYAATGGTVTTSGDYKIHTFTGDGCFVVSSAAKNLPAADLSVDYLIVGGAGGGGGNTEPGASGGGGGAGGFRLSNTHSLPAPTTSPLANPTGLTLSAQTYPVTVGGGGAGGASQQAAIPGSNSTVSTITSAGGGRGGSNGPAIPTPINGASRTVGASGGSGGGGTHGCNPGGSGNTPPVSPPQGNDGGDGGPSQPSYASGGGGGAGASGQPVQGTSPQSGGVGGDGSYVSPSLAVGCAGTPGPVGSTRYFGGGGGGSSQPNPSGPRPGGAGGGGTGGVGNPAPGTAGSANTGGGGGGGGGNLAATGGAGGKGIVILKYKFQN